MAILDLQSNLQSEIQAKESIRKELSTAKAVQVALEKWAVDVVLQRLLNWWIFLCCEIVLTASWQMQLIFKLFFA